MSTTTSQLALADPEHRITADDVAALAAEYPSLQISREPGHERNWEGARRRLFYFGARGDAERFQADHGGLGRRADHGYVVGLELEVGMPQRCEVCDERFDWTSGLDSKVGAEFGDPVKLDTPSMVCHPDCAPEGWVLA